MLDFTFFNKVRSLLISNCRQVSYNVSIAVNYAEEI